MECAQFASNRVKCSGVHALAGNGLMIGIPYGHYIFASPMVEERIFPWLYRWAFRVHEMWPYDRFGRKISFSYRRTSLPSVFSFYCWKKQQHSLYLEIIGGMRGPHMISGFCVYFGTEFISRIDIPAHNIVKPFGQSYKFTHPLMQPIDKGLYIVDHWDEIEPAIDAIHHQMSNTLAVELPEDDFFLADSFRPDFGDVLSGPFTREELARGFWEGNDWKDMRWIPPKDFTEPSSWTTDPWLVMNRELWFAQNP